MRFERRLPLFNKEEKGAFVCIQPQPVHTFYDSLYHGFRRSLHIRIFDAKNENAVLLASEKPVEQRCPGTTDVEVTGR